MTLARLAYAAAAALTGCAAWMWWPPLASVRRALRAALEARPRRQRREGLAVAVAIACVAAFLGFIAVSLYGFPHP